MKVAALDLGSNTFLCLIVEVSKKAELLQINHTYSDEVEVVRLGQDVGKSKRIHPDALFRAESCLNKFRQTIDRHKPEKILAMATSAARDSENRQELFDIGKKFGIPIEIIPGQQEALITFQGATSGHSDKKRRLVIDIGGGSTEFIVGTIGQIEKSKSLDIGCVRLTENIITHQPTPDWQITEAIAVINESLKDIKDFVTEPIDEILAVAGTPTSLVAAELGYFDTQKIDGFFLTKKSLQNWKYRLQNATVEEKIKMGIPKGRADVILIGVLILLRTLETFEKEQLVVSTRGVRHGIAIEMARRYLP